MFLACILVELAVLVALAWMDKLPQFLANVAAGFIALCFLAFLKGDGSFAENLGVCAILGLFACMGAKIIWYGARVVCMAINDPNAAAQAIDIVAMQSAVAKSLAGKPSNPNSYGNRRVAEEVVRALKDRSSKK
jgi:putative flippase GtrA